MSAPPLRFRLADLFPGPLDRLGQRDGEDPRVDGRIETLVVARRRGWLLFTNATAVSAG